MSREPRKTTRQGEGREKRIPLGTQKPKLAVKASPGMVGRWVNDTGARIQQAENADWNKVMAPPMDIDGEERPITHIVGTQENGQPLTAFYMEIPKKLYNEDQKAKQQQVDLVDEAIAGGNVEGEVGKDGRYVPSEGINYRRG